MSLLFLEGHTSSGPSLAGYRIEDEKVLLDPRTVLPEEESITLDSYVAKRVAGQFLTTP